MQLVVRGSNFAPFDIDDNGHCERAALYECVTNSGGWSAYEKDKASVLLREIISRADDIGAGRLLQGASRAMYMALIGPWCGIQGRHGESIFPELRWCDFSARVVCFRAGLSSPLTTKQFEEYREQLEELWGGSVAIETGAAIGAAPGCVVVRPAPPVTRSIARVPAPPQAPLHLPEKIPLVLPDPQPPAEGENKRLILPGEGGWE